MRRQLQFIVLSVLGILAGGQSAFAAIEDYASLIRIECENPAPGGYPVYGSGIVISADGLILTAASVAPEGANCKGSRGPSLQFGTWRPLTRISVSTRYDAAVLRMEPRAYEAFHPVGFVTLGGSAQSWRVAAYGFPNGGGELSVREGVIATTVPDARGMIETTALTAPGMGGGPVLVSEEGATRGGLVGLIGAPRFDPGTGSVVSYDVLAAQEIAAELGIAAHQPRTNADANGDRISESYTRLVGARPVTRLMQLFEFGAAGASDAYSAEESTYNENWKACFVRQPEGDPATIDCNLYFFYQGASFNKAKPLLTSLWREARHDASDLGPGQWDRKHFKFIYESSGRLPDSLVCAGIEASEWYHPSGTLLTDMKKGWYLNARALEFIYPEAGPIDRSSFESGLGPPLSVFESRINWDREKPPWFFTEQMMDGPEEFAIFGMFRLAFQEAGLSPNTVCMDEFRNNTGFLFMVFENLSGATLKNVRLRYAVAPKGAADDAFWSGLDRDDDEYIDDDRLADFEQRQLRVPDIVAGGLNLWLTSIYSAGEDKFEKFTLFDFELPVSISYTVNGAVTTEKLRLPRRRSVAPIPIPYGWTSQ